MSNNFSNNEYITVQISKIDLLDALMNRLVDFGNLDPDDDEYNAFENYYADLIDGGCFDDAKIDIMKIVDNDWYDLGLVDEGNYTDYVDDEDEVDSFDSFKEYARNNDTYLAESDNGKVVLIGN